MAERERVSDTISDFLLFFSDFCKQIIPEKAARNRPAWPWQISAVATKDVSC